eukprot:gene18738-13500_t
MLMQEGTTKAVSMAFLMLCKCQENLTDNFEGGEMILTGDHSSINNC